MSDNDPPSLLPDSSDSSKEVNSDDEERNIYEESDTDSDSDGYVRPLNSVEEAPEESLEELLNGGAGASAGRGAGKSKASRERAIFATASQLMEKGRFTKAVDWLKKGLEVVNKGEDDDEELAAKKPRVLMNLCHCYLNIKKYDEADGTMKLFSHELENFPELDDESLINFHEYLALVLYSLQHRVLALFCALKGLALKSASEVCHKLAEDIVRHYPELVEQVKTLPLDCLEKYLIEGTAVEDACIFKAADTPPCRGLRHSRAARNFAG